MKQLVLFLLIAVGAIVGQVAAARSVANAAEREPPGDILKRNGVEPCTADVVAFLRTCNPDATTAMQIAVLVRRLGNDSFNDREEATRRLATFGGVAIGSLRAALQNDDLEIATRARMLVQRWESGGGSERHERLVTAACQWLAESRPPETVTVLLELFPNLTNELHRQTAAAAIRTCARPEDAQVLQKAISIDTPALLIAALPAWERVAGEDALKILPEFLEHADDQVRLTAARALIDRQPRSALAALVKLLASENGTVRAQAAWILQQASGIPPEKDNHRDIAALVEQWKAWSNSPAADRLRPLGETRWQLTLFGTLFKETFVEDAANLQATYQQWQYSSTNGGKASVAKGVLRLDGSQAEGDSRLFITSEKVLGLPTFPQRFQIKAKLGGEAEGAGGWHVGVSVGNVRFLFHPETEGGAFRVERVDNHLFLLNNESMPFTPAGGMLYDMTIDVRPGGVDTVKFDLFITDLKSNKQYVKVLSLKTADVGELKRVGLERSGRTGGGALFGPLTLGTLPTPSGQEAREQP